MWAMAADAVADPTKLEKEVKRQEKEWQENHLKHNKDRHIEAKKNKKDKWRKKMER